MVLGLLLGLWLIRAGRGMRERHGLGSGETVSLDRMTLASRRYLLTRRPDRLIRQGGIIWPAEWKSALQLRLWHRAQMGVCFLLIEDQFVVGPPNGFVVCGDGTRHRVENTAELRAWVLDVAGQTRAMRREVN